MLDEILDGEVFEELLYRDTYVIKCPSNDCDESFVSAGGANIHIQKKHNGVVPLIQHGYDKSKRKTDHK